MIYARLKTTATMLCAFPSEGGQLLGILTNKMTIIDSDLYEETKETTSDADICGEHFIKVLNTKKQIICDRYQLEDFEQGLCVLLVNLQDKTVNSNKDLLIVGTSSSFEGEETPSMGNRKSFPTGKE